MSATNRGADAARSVDDVLITSELAHRPSRPPDHAAENRALAALAEEMAGSPGGVLQKCAELVMELCRADSAGISILEPGGTDGIFRWHAAAGAFAANLDGTMPREPSPCGTVLARNRVLLFSEAERFFPDLRGVEPRIHENLLAPWHAGGEAVGTIWAIKHTPEGRFDAEDARVLASLAHFASAAYQMNLAVAEAKQGREELERRVAERTTELMERKRAEEALRASQERLRLIIEGARDHAIFITDPQGRIVDWTPGAIAVFGWSAEEAVGHPVDMLFTPEDRQAGAPERERETARTDGVAPDQRWHMRKDGARVFIDGSTRALRDPDGSFRGFLKIGQDVTERKSAEEALRESERRFRTLAEGIPQLVFRSRSSGYRTWGSPQWIDFTGLSEKESLGFGWLDAVHADDRAATMAAWAEAEARGTFSAEHRVRRAADGAYRWFQSRALPMRDGPEAGLPDKYGAEWLGTSTDIEDQVRAREVLARGREELEALVATRTAELMAAEATLRQAQKMEAVGQLTGGIAHDFNNMLQAMAGALEMAGYRIADGRPGEALRHLDLARRSVSRAAALTSRLLAFARRQRLEPKPVDVDGLIAGMADLIRRTVGPGIAVELKLRDGAGRVLCDPNELESALLNLCINARDAMPNGGRLTLATDDTQLTGSDVAGLEGVSAGAYTMISVQDTGTGMPPEVRERAFEPFFTTKPQGQGTGLGLSQVYGFARQSDGLVRLESVPGQGTTVRLFLPRRKRTESAEQPLAHRGAEWDGAENTVLLVEDEEAVRMPASERLRELGYSVLEAADGPAALRLLADHPRVDLLVTDVGLPSGMNGRQVAEAVRERVPGIPVLFITGYAGTELPPGSEVIGKPFALDVLVRRVQALLAGHAADQRRVPTSR